MAWEAVSYHDFIAQKLRSRRAERPESGLASRVATLPVRIWSLEPPGRPTWPRCHLVRHGPRQEPDAARVG